MSDYTELVKALLYCEFGWSARTCDNCEYSKTDCQLLLSDAAAAIEALQAQLPKRGEWIYKPKDAIEMMFTLPKCSVCGHESSDANNYCPRCGAKMEVQE